MIKRPCHILFIILLAFTLLLSGCSVESDRSDKPSPDWSRGLRLGQSNLRQPVALQVDANKHVHLVWCDEGLYYARLDAQAHILTNEPLPIDLPQPRKPQLLVDNQDRLHLAWLIRDQEVQKLYHVPIDPQGKPGTPLLLSWENEDISSFQMYLSPAGKVTFIWASELENGIRGLVHTTLQDPSRPTTLVQHGIDPHVLVDNAGTVHLAWLRPRGLTSRTVYYATLEDEEDDTPNLKLVPENGQKLTDFEFSEGAIYSGPIIGVDTHTVYVIWAVRNLGGGLTPTAAFSYYISFKPGEASATHPQTIRLPSEFRPTYEDRTAPYGFTKLASLSPAKLAYSSDFVDSPATVTSQKAELPITFSLLTRSTAESQIQLATVILAQGTQVGYQLASKTTNASLTPSLAADSDTNLHLAWIDTAGFKEYEVYYASNAPQAKGWLDRTSADDLALGAARLIFGVLSGLGLLPIAGIWSFPAMVWVVVFFIVSGQEELERTPARVGFAISVVIYVAIKVLLLPGLFAGTPFLYQVPPALSTVIGIAVPVIILALALTAVYIYYRRAERATILKAYFVLALTDVLLTLILYGPGFFGQS
jgi:hypothetical protein